MRLRSHNVLNGLLALLLGAGLAAPAARAAEKKEPDGFGKAKFGMTLPQVQKIYASLRDASGPPATPQPGEAPPPFTLRIFVLDDTAVGPLKGCRVEFRFITSKEYPGGSLYEVQFRCPEKEKVLEYLQDQYGPPTKVGTKDLEWTGQKTVITEVPASGAFMFGDKQRSTVMQLSLLHYLMAHPQSQVPASSEAAVTPPAATPVPEAK